jgi:hypothetical protein
MWKHEHRESVAPAEPQRGGDVPVLTGLAAAERLGEHADAGDDDRA